MLGGKGVKIGLSISPCNQDHGPERIVRLLESKTDDGGSMVEVSYIRDARAEERLDCKVIVVIDIFIVIVEF